MYQNIYFDKNTKAIHLWDDKKGYLKFPFQKYGYIKDSSGDHTTLDGNKVKKVTSWSIEDEKDGKIYESDLNPTIRVLIDTYYDSDNISENHRELFYDIEVSTEDGFANPSDPKNEITAISFYYKQEDCFYTYILDKEGLIESKENKKFKLKSYNTEISLLKDFIKDFAKISPTIISGWNSESFDLPYLINRIVLIIGEKEAIKLSPINKVNYDEYDNIYFIAGVTHWDYMNLYKRFNQNEEPSYSLNSISLKELERGKLKYDGNLNDLLKNDLKKYIEYNIEDVRLLKDLDDKLTFIELAKNLCHKGHIPYEELWYTSTILDGASLTFTKRIGIIAPNKKKKIKFELDGIHNEGAKKIYFKSNLPKNLPKSASFRIHKSKSSFYEIEYNEWKENYVILTEELSEPLLPKYEIKLYLVGAYVKPPVPGKYKWIYDLDLTAMYPSFIMSLNISPETKIGKIINWDPEEYIKEIEKTYIIYIKNKKIELSKTELKEFFREHGYSISINGIMYDMKNKGLIPAILELWFEERNETKNLMKKYKAEGNKNLSHMYNLKQQTVKRLLNSFYGVLGLESFRFFDIENAEAITSSGRSMIRFTGLMINKYYQKELDYEKDQVIAADTDSCFVSALPLIEKWYPGIVQSDEKEMVKKTIQIATKLQTFINKKYDAYAKAFLNLDKHRFSIKQENVSKAGLFIAKKRYALLIVNEDGVFINKLEVKGMDIVRSDFSQAFKDFMIEIVTDILNDFTKEQITEKIILFRKSMSSESLENIMSGSSVKDLKKFDTENRNKFNVVKGTPVHANAALMYNDLIDHLNEIAYQKIISGDKIKWCYLKKNPLNVNVMAIKNYNDPPKTLQFISKFIDYDKTFENRISNKIQSYFDACGWGEIILNENVSTFFEF